MRKSARNLGFTLIELMITVGIIAILSGLLYTVLDPKGLRSKARDEERVADLNRIQSALEMYYSDNREYPTSIGWSSPPGILVNYLDPIPEDPLNTSQHNYIYTSNGTTYCIAVRMEADTSGNGCPQSECSAVPIGSDCFSVANP